jgi:hypothetical protein
VIASFIGVALLQAWPLPLRLSTHLTGNPGGDTGSYIWNFWVFRYELVELHTTPFKTETILSLNGPTDLSLHNYTIASALLGAPLVPLVGLVAAFNLVYLLKVALAGIGMFLLVRHVHARHGVGVAEAWLAGLLFACSPFLVARSTAHFSLVAAAPLPFFMLYFDRAWQHHRARDAAAAGACLAWAGFSDPYYAIYCVLLGGAVVARDVTVSRVTSPDSTHRIALRAVDVLLWSAVAVVLVVAGMDLGEVRIGSVTISMHSLYTPVLVLTLLATARWIVAVRPRVQWSPSLTGWQFVSLVGVAAVVGALLMSPQLFAIAARASDGRMVHVPVPWRSSAPGLDAVSFLLPNPNHPLAPKALVDWVSRQPGHFEENVASIPWTAIAVILIAWRLGARARSRFWLAVTLLFAAMALGPFIRVAGLDTYIPTPWTFLRYVPLIAEARMPARMAVIVVMGIAVLFAGALATITARAPDRRRWILVGVGAALVFELMPAPRRLHAATVPSIYEVVARDPAPTMVLELPFGVRDGLSSFGDYTARSQFHQTFHGKPLVGGSMSRVSDRKKAFYRSWPLLNTLMQLSEPQLQAGVVTDSVVASGRDFVDRVNLGYVVMETGRVRPELRTFAIRALGLELIDEGDGYELYKPAR